jgi:hypothetical protein
MLAKRNTFALVGINAVPNEESVQHCRSTGPRVRGCRGPDLVLAKE